MKRYRTHPAARPMLGLATGLLVSGVAAGLVLGGLALSEWSRISTVFNLNTIHVLGNRVMDKEDIIRISGLERGRNIWSADLSEIEKRLMLDRGFEQVSLTRRLPGTIVLKVKELQPIALVQLDRLYGVTERGDLTLLTPGTGMPDLPVITVAASSYRRAPDAVEARDRGFETLKDAMLVNPEMVRALYLMRALRTMSPWMYDELSEIHVSSPDDPIAYTVEGGLVIRFGTGHYPRKIEMLRRTVERLEADAIRTRLIDLRFKDQVIVRPIVSSRTTGERS